MEKILFFTSFLYVREKILTLLPSLLVSAKSLHFPVQFLLQLIRWCTNMLESLKGEGDLFRHTRFTTQ